MRTKISLWAVAVGALESQLPESELIHLVSVFLLAGKSSDKMPIVTLHIPEYVCLRRRPVKPPGKFCSDQLHFV